MSNAVTNDHLVLLGGRAATGKSASLMGLKNPEGVMYLNCENGKKLPFPSKFKQFTITDPLQIFEAFDHAASSNAFHTIVVDSLTYLMDMFESMYVINSPNTMKAWGDYSQYFKKLMQTYVAKSKCKVVFIAHHLDTLNEADMRIDTCVPVKGSLKNNGIESYFSCVIAAKSIALKELENYGSPLLNITEEEEVLGFKYVFQTRKTKGSVGLQVRAPLAMWTNKETYIDNNMQLVFDRLQEYYV